MVINYEDLKRELNIKILSPEENSGYKNVISLNAKDLRMFETETDYIFAFLTYEDTVESIKVSKQEVKNIKSRDYIYRCIEKGKDSIGLIIEHSCFDYIEDTVNNDKDYNEEELFTYNNDIIIDIKDIITKTNVTNIVCKACIYSYQDKELNIFESYFNKEETFNLELGIGRFDFEKLEKDKLNILEDIFNKYNQSIKNKSNESIIKLFGNNITLKNIVKEDYLIIKDILKEYLSTEEYNGGYFVLEYSMNIIDIQNKKGETHIFDGRE